MSKSVDEVSVLIGLHTQYPWKFKNIITGKDNFEKVLRDAKEQARDERES